MKPCCTRYHARHHFFKAIPLTVSALLFFLPAVLACPCSEISDVEPPAKEFSISEGLAYAKSASYRKEFAAAIKGAREACQKRLGEKNLAIVADIDETLLDNRPYFQKQEKPNWNEFSKWVNESAAPTLKPTAEFLSWARKKGFAIFLITGRKEKDRRATINNLINQNIAFDGLFMRANDDKSRASEMKSKHRKQIVDMGYTIVVNIGDQFSDLAGGLAEDCQKLPNQIYFVK